MDGRRVWLLTFAISAPATCCLVLLDLLQVKYTAYADIRVVCISAPAAASSSFTTDKHSLLFCLQSHQRVSSVIRLSLLDGCVHQDSISESAVNKMDVLQLFGDTCDR